MKKKKEFDKKDFKWIVGLGFLGVTIALGCFHISLKYLGAAKGAVIFSMNPVFSSLAAVIFLNEKFTSAKVVGLVFGFIGVYIISVGFQGLEFSSMVGPGLMLLSAISFGIYISASKIFVKKYGALLTTGIAFTAGALFYIPFIGSYTIQNFNTTIWYVLYLSLFATGIAYILYFYGLKNISVAAGSSIFYMKPILATILSAMILKESFGMNFFIGLGIIFFSLTITLFGNKLIKIKT